MLQRSRKIVIGAVATFSFAAAAPSVAAQAANAPAPATPRANPTVDPGMTREQVVAVLGQPIASRSFGPRTFLFYPNGRERRAGMYDLITLENDAVVDAIFRSPGRRYSGTSSSPGDVKPEPTNVVPVPTGEITTGESLAAPAFANPSGTTVLPSITAAPAPARSSAPAGAAAAATTAPGAPAAADTTRPRTIRAGEPMPPQPPRTVFPTPAKPPQRP